MLNNLASSIPRLLDIDFSESKLLYELALAIAERTLRADSPRTLRTFRIRLNLEDLKMAELFACRSRVEKEIWEQGRVHREHGRYADSEPHYRRLLAHAQRDLGPDHPGVVTLREYLRVRQYLIALINKTST